MGEPTASSEFELERAGSHGATAAPGAPVRAPTPPAERARIDRRAVAAWVLYDLANTIFSMNIVSLYFSLWVVNDMGGRDSDYGLANSLAMALIFVTAPFLGALSDQTPRRMPFLVASTLLCCAATLPLGSVGLWLSLGAFVVAVYAFEAGLIFYDALLPSVSTPETVGRIGGLGVGIGYVGSFIGIGLGLTILGHDPTAKPLLFQLTALCFLLFALPCFVFVRERARAGAEPFGAVAARRALTELRGTVRRVREYPDLRRFLVGRVFYTDAANTSIAFMGIYVTNEVGFTERQAQYVLLAGIAAALVGALAAGVIVDRIGPKRTLNGVLVLWLGLLVLVAAIGFLKLDSALVWVVAPLAGIALGGTWAADRPLMLSLAPPQHLGQFYGLYAMVGRFSAVLGPLLWALVVDGLGLGRPAAVASLCLMVVVALALLRGVRDRPRPAATPAPPQAAA